MWRLLEGLERAIVVFLMLAMPVLYGINVIMHNFAPRMARHFVWIEELALFFLVWLVFIGLGYTLDRGRHVSMDLGQRFLPPRVMLVARTLVDALGAAFCFYVAYIGWQFVARIIATGQVSNTLYVSMGWLYGALPVGMFLLGIRYLRYLFSPEARRFRSSHDIAGDGGKAP